jgi:hypothetical protein
MKNIYAVIVGIMCLVLSMHGAMADVGVGISPTKVVLQFEGGGESQFSLLVFNSGDSNLKISLSADGEIAKFISFSPAEEEIEPEARPHALPIKNGKNFVVTFDAPRVSRPTKYTGTISATGTPGEGSQFGGSVGVATQVEITVVPAESLFQRIPPVYLYVAAGIVALVVIVFALRRMHMHISFGSETKMPSEERP